jgi:extracellular elastinolytic metalloproteinase
MRHRPAPSRRPIATLSVLAVVVTLTVAQPATGTPGALDTTGLIVQGEGTGLPNVDARRGQIAPSAGQLAIVAAAEATARWNRFGTIETLIRDGDYLATGLSGDPVSAARSYVVRNRSLFRLSEKAVNDLEALVSRPMGRGSVVMFRQRFGGLAAGIDGLISVALVDGKVTYAASSAAGDSAAPAPASLSATEAFLAAADDVGRPVAAEAISDVRQENAWTTFAVAGFAGRQAAKLVAVPFPGAAARAAWLTVLLDNRAEPMAFASYVDARTGEVLIRESLLAHAEETADPEWTVFPASPSLDYSSTDTRDLWCWEGADPACDLVVGNDEAHAPWDARPTTGASSFTTRGNSSIAVENWAESNPFTVGSTYATPSPTREYTYPWTNQWYEEACSPTVFASPEKNDIDAALANLFAMHNRMHDWSYRLGFVEATWNMQKENLGLGGEEDDFEQGNAQAGAMVGVRDNANQITGPDGRPPITNMYVWQPLPAAFYAPCVDGDFDMSVIGHEYTHAISNRMVAGPNAGVFGTNSRAMGESWSDLTAVEYLHEYGFVPVSTENPFAVGPYVTGDHQAGIRNYGMNNSPLNFSDIGYDFACNATCPPFTQVHADGEIWSALNFAIRQAMNERYDDQYPSDDPVLQAECADGLHPADQCPGNRRWIQLVFDAYLLLPFSTPTMLHVRDAMLAADMTRFGGANQDLLWNIFASKGFGINASIGSSEDADPVASWRSPLGPEGRVKFQPVDEDGNQVPNAELFVGQYEGRVTPVADTDPATGVGSGFSMVPGTYEFVARANGHGMQRFELTVPDGGFTAAKVTMPSNLASSSNGATATGDGINIDKLIDDTEETNWASLNSPVIGKRVTVQLDPSQPSWTISSIQVSAMLRPIMPSDPGGDTASQSRFSALRAFDIYTCEVTAEVDCADDAEFTLAFSSPLDAFPAIAPRPRAPDLILRSFDIPDTDATYVRLVVVHNQCTGGPDYQGEQDNDPATITDCEDGSTQDLNVRAAELQVFGA